MQKSTRAIVTVLGRDQIGIIAWVSGKLASQKVNILDISQTIMANEFFTMIMLVDLESSLVDLTDLGSVLGKEGSERGLQITIQHEDVFAYMHRI